MRTTFSVIHTCPVTSSKGPSAEPELREDLYSVHRKFDRLVCSLAHLASHRLKSRQVQAKHLLPRNGRRSTLRSCSPPLFNRAEGLAKDNIIIPQVLLMRRLLCLTLTYWFIDRCTVYTCAARCYPVAVCSVSSSNTTAI